MHVATNLRNKKDTHDSQGSTCLRFTPVFAKSSCVFLHLMYTIYLFCFFIDICFDLRLDIVLSYVIAVMVRPGHHYNTDVRGERKFSAISVSATQPAWLCVIGHREPAKADVMTVNVAAEQSRRLE